MKNVTEKIAESRRIKNPKYDLTYPEILCLMKKENNLFGTIADSFHVGYLQGYKAAKAQSRGVKS